MVQRDSWPARGRRRVHRRVEAPVLGQDRRLQLPEVVAGFEPELLAEHPTAVLERPEGVGLPPGAVEGEHQEPPEPLAERMPGDELLELGDRGQVPTELQLQLEPLLDDREAELREPRDDTDRELVVGEVGQRVAAPQPVGLGQHVDRRGEVAIGHERAPLGHELLVPVGVHGVGRELEDVATASHRDEVGRSQGPPELGGEALQAVANARRRIVTPEGIDELLGRHDAPRVQREQREEGALLRPGHHDLPPVVAHLELTEHAHAHGSTVPLPRPSPQCGISRRSAWSRTLRP